ncbi:glycosyltransferase family 2 protein [Candidatus Dojkabacteria bacterium]|nr:glycosyltransferase family 2 protein [Candidatus Dojkabacteria bacterium]
MESQNNSKVDLSVIYTVRNEEDLIEKVVGEMMDELNKLRVSFEVIAPNVPSIDNSFSALEKVGKKYDNFFPVNMVQTRADNLQKGYQMLLGIRLARGKKIILTDSDGQADPKDYRKLLEAIDSGADAVFGWRQDRSAAHGFFYNLTSFFQNTLWRILTGMKIHDKNTGLKAMTDVAAKSLTLYGRNFRDIAYQLTAKSFKVTEVPINWRERKGGIQNFKFLDRLLGGTLDLLVVVYLTKMLDKPFRYWGLQMVTSGALGVFIWFVAVVFLMIADSDLMFTTAILVAFIGSLAEFRALISLAIGVITEFVESGRRFDVSDYYIIDDPKGITQRL